MFANNEKIESKKVALNKQTYEKLKDFSRYNGLKLRAVIDTFADLLLQDDVLSKRVVELTLENQPEKSSERQS